MRTVSALRVVIAAFLAGHLPLTLPLATPVRAQLLHASSATCWEARFSTSTRNDDEAFKARSDP